MGIEGGEEIQMNGRDYLFNNTVDTGGFQDTHRQDLKKKHPQTYYNCNPQCMEQRKKIGNLKREGRGHI
jgi:hypothetical protein